MGVSDDLSIPEMYTILIVVACQSAEYVVFHMQIGTVYKCGQMLLIYPSYI